MNLSAMAKDWRTEGAPARRSNIQVSIRRGTYSQKNIAAFVKDVDENGYDKNEAGRRNSIPKGSVHHVYNLATQQ